MIAGNLIKSKKATTIVLVFFFSLFGIQSGHAAYYPSGPQLNVPVSTVTSGGWTICFEDEFDDSGTLVQTMLDLCTGEKILLAGKFNNNQSEIALLAAGERSAVFQVQTVYSEKTLNNGTYFYFFPLPDTTFDSSQSIGFSRSPNIEVNNCDTETDFAEYRLCRHISDDNGTPYFDEGYRIGSLQDNGNLQAMFLVYQQGEVEKKVAPTLTRQTTNLSFDQSFYGSDQISDPTGEIASILKEINRKYGKLISLK